MYFLLREGVPYHSNTKVYGKFLRDSLSKGALLKPGSIHGDSWNFIKGPEAKELLPYR